MSKRFRLVCVLLTAVLLLGLLPANAVQAAGAESVTCLIDTADKSKVNVTVQTSASVSAADGNLYLFAVPTYVDDLIGQEPVASVAYTGAGQYSIPVDLNVNTEASLLYSKFYVAVKSGGTYSAINGGHYITNPEVLAASSVPRMETASKKGVQIDFYIPTDLEDLGVKHSFFNICFQNLISNTPTDYSYTYNGKTYYFTNILTDYDMLVSNMTKAGMSVTVALLNEYRAGYEYLVHPGVSANDGSINYAVNTSTQQGVETVAAVTHFLAERYNGTNAAYGCVENWIFGNEVNDNRQYYYMGPQNVDTFVQEYLQSFRVAYSAIKSAYSNANVYICLQHRWNVADGTTDYGGKSFVDKFAAYTKYQGDLDWGLAYHPYSFPMNDADILNDGQATIDQNGNATFGNEVTNSVDSPVVTMKNLNVLTEYMHNSALLNPNGQVRSIILSEEGYTSYSNITGQNEAKQAANIALAYYIAEMNQDVDAFILRGHSDEEEGSEYYRFGLWRVGADGKPVTEKFSANIYRYLDTAKADEYTAFAKPALNISDWSSVVPGWNANKLSGMGTTTDAALYTVSGSSGTTQVTGAMLGQWEKGYNVYDIGQFDYTPAYYENGLAVANENAYPVAYQGVETHFDTPKDLSGANYLTLDVNFKTKDASDAGKRLEAKVRLHSGNDTFDAVGVINVNQDYTLCLDISEWSGRSSIDGIEVLNRDVDQSKAFCGTFTVYNVTGAASVSDLQKLDGVRGEKIDLSGADIACQRNFNYTGSAITPKVTVKLNGGVLEQHKDFDVIYHDNVNAGTAKIVVVGIGNYTGYTVVEFTIQSGFPTVYNGIDYAPVYAYGYYKENNPFVVAEVGDDPEALLEHFVTKGMTYALQGIGDFNVLAYAKINDDLQPKYGNNWPQYYLHYIVYGIAEGRSTSGIQPDDMEAPEYPGVETPGCDHNFEVTAETPPTCTQNGSRETACTLCGTAGATEVIFATGHVFDAYEDQDCNICGLVKTSQPRPVTHMYRMYNPNTGEHFYTGSDVEKGDLLVAGWQYEGVGFSFPTTTGKPVHRLFEPATGEHLYTMDEAEKANLMASGWNYEGIAFNSAFEDEVTQFRLHNPNEVVGAYHFTSSPEERDNLISLGWEYQGIGWYSCWKGTDTP